MNSIGLQYGFAVDTLWNHPENAELKRKRGDPDVLQTGDVVHIPDLATKKQGGATDERHVFRRRFVPAKFSLRLMNGDEPRAGVAYRLELDGAIRNGKTDGNGVLEETIPPNIRFGRLFIDETEEQFDLDFGGLRPIDCEEGVRQRLENLRYIRPRASDAARDAGVIRFKQDHCGLEIKNDGTATPDEVERYREVDDETRQKLVEVHGS